ncbi:MAG: acyl-CoA dehydrogenase family protein [Methylococcales bacterium]|nr:acyl-CoA dehydrogenase family protein [Methylococcales bacterium]MCK5924638.1 acyl-CoA dehydrogenase family protein [Methylococcales bacterium]
MMRYDFNDLPVAGDKKSSRSRFLYCANSGFLRHAVTVQQGGHGDDFLALMSVHQQLGQYCLDSGLILSLNAHLWGAIFPLINYGSDAQQQRWLPRLLSGDMIAGHAITEPLAGSDINALTTTATLTKKGFVLNGHKRFITNAPIADMLMIYAQVEHKLTAFLVKRDDANVVFTDDYSVDGCALATMGEVVLDNCLIPLGRQVGRIGGGGMMIQSALELERAFIFAGLSGIMEWQLKTVISYSRERQIKGQFLGQNQAISHKIAEMKLRLDTINLWLRECATLKIQKKRISLVSAETKLYASEAFLQSSLDAVHIMGAAGLLETHKMNTLIQDAVASRLFSGSSEIQKNIISALLGTGEGYKGKQKK